MKHQSNPVAIVGGDRRRRKKILIINCYFPEMREPIKRVNEVPNALAPVLLAGYFSSDRCDIRLYNEVSSGFIEIHQPDLLGWPDMVVMTGLTATFDRLLHITAYARTLNPSVIVVAGGHAVRTLPRYSAKFLDYACPGDVEEIRDVIHDALGSAYVSKDFCPRYDLAYWIKRLGYAESSRNCNFRCSFCSLTGVGRSYEVPSFDYLDMQMERMGKRWTFFFSDNQVAGDGNKTLGTRLGMVQRRRAAGQFRHWSGFATDSFFWEDENIRLARETGCISLFVGVESFDDSDWLSKVNKRQNSRYSQVDLIRRCLEGGILFQYGLVFDPVERTVAQMHRELDIICENPEIPGPNFIFMATPFPGTPDFHQRLADGRILPNTRIRDLEGSTLCVKPIDPIEDVVDFIRNGKNFRGYRRRFLAHQMKFLKRYRHSLSLEQKIVSSVATAAIMAPGVIASPGALFRKKGQRTHVSTTERLDCVYTPQMYVHSKYRDYFEPTRITDHAGELNPQLEADALDTGFKREAPLKMVASR